MTNIGQDLNHYYKFLTAQPDPDSLLGPTVVLSLREFMEVSRYTHNRFIFTAVLAKFDLTLIQLIISA